MLHPRVHYLSSVRCRRCDRRPHDLHFHFRLPFRPSSVSCPTGLRGQESRRWTRGRGIPLRTNIMPLATKSSVRPTGSQKPLPLRRPVLRVLLLLPHTAENLPPLLPRAGRPLYSNRVCSPGYLPRGIHRSPDPGRTCPRYRPCLAVVWTLAWTRRRRSKSYGCWITTRNWFIRGISGRMSVRITMVNFTSLGTRAQ